MSLYYLKPIVWNTEKYQRPSGEGFTSGFPKENGFGHEEWNNSPAFEFEENGEQFRVFHTEGIGNQPLDDYPGDIFVFMIASHNGGQYLVGVSGGATSLFSNREERERLVKRLRLDVNRWQEAWALRNVKDCYGNDENAFRERWNHNLHWVPTWQCPANLFLWLEAPLLLDPGEIAGKSRLITMYGSYQEVSRETAGGILRKIPATGANGDILRNLKARCSSNGLDVKTDIIQVQKNADTDPTAKEALIQARLGQGQFRESLMRIWNNSCSVTGCTVPELLRASHIKPWRDSSNNQRLDPNNGLLLVANLDALFDSGLISFGNSGEMLVSERLAENERTRLGIPRPLRGSLNKAQCDYLAHHRKKFLFECQ